MHVKLDDQYQTYSKIIETHLNMLLNSFAVETQYDLRLLQDILQKNGQKPSIYLYQSGKKLDISSGVPSRQFKTIYDFIDVFQINVD